MGEFMHCCCCGRDWLAAAIREDRGVECPRCSVRSSRTVGDCLACQDRAVIPREQWTCKPVEAHEAQEAGR